MKELKKNTLHEQSSKGFKRTPNGSIYTENIKVVYSIFLICLDLVEKESSSSLLISAFSKHSYPYSFSVNTAIKVMKKMELNVDMTTTSISISYSIKEELAHHLLKLFMEAKLLHTPADRTRKEPKDKILLQPTPKGVAILHQYIKDIGLKKIPAILLSDLNSIQLFNFERSGATDSIIHSDYLIYLLFTRIMGSTPNIWSPSNPNDKLPSLSKLLEYKTDSFSFESMEYDPIFGFHNKSSSQSNMFNQDNLHEKVDMRNENRQSPFAHKYFTNPDSDSHIQYYVSDVGIRLFKDKIFDEYVDPIEYTFTTKVLWQWLMDCTDIMNPKEASAVVSLLAKEGLIEPIFKSKKGSSPRKFIISKEIYCKLTNLGVSVVKWYVKKDDRNDLTFDSETIKSGSCNSLGIEKLGLKTEKAPLEYTTTGSSTTSSQISETRTIEFKDVITDPGMRFLFKQFLQEELCIENLDAYLEILRFLKKMRTLMQLIASKSSNTNKGKLTSMQNNIADAMVSAIKKQANECLELSYKIYSTFIIEGAPYQLNIDHNLRESFTDLILHPTSPVRTELNKTSNEAVTLEDDFFDTTITEINENSNTEYLNHTANNDKDASRLSKTFLTLDLQNDERELYKNNENSYELSVEDELSPTVKLLSKTCPLFIELKDKLSQLMKNDSMPKFRNSKIFSEFLITSTIHEKNFSN